MSARSHLGKCCLLGVLHVSALGSECTAQTDQLVAEVDQNGTGESPNQQYNHRCLMLNIFFGRR